MTPELVAISIVLWAWCIALWIAPRFERQLGATSWPGRVFTGLASALERGWKGATGRLRP